MCKWKLVPIYYCVRKDRCECDSRVSRTTSDVSPICMCAVLPCWCYRGATNTSCNLFLLTVQKELLQKHKSLAIRSITKIPGLLVLRANSSIWFTFFTLFHYTFFYLTESLKQYLICDILYTPRLTEKKTKLNHAVVHNTSYICFNLNLLKKKLIQTVIYSKLLKQPNCSLLEIKKHMTGCYTVDMHNDRVIWLMSPQRLIWNRTQISWFFIRFFFSVFGIFQALWAGRSRKLWQSNFQDRNTNPATESGLLHWNLSNKHQQCMGMEALVYMAGYELLSRKLTQTYSPAGNKCALTAVLSQ